VSDTRSVSASFPTLDAARSARRRLARAGFARNSIDIDRRQDGFEVAIRTREENRDRAARILSGQSMPRNLREAAEGARHFVEENTAVSLGLAALAGFVLFGLTRRR